VPARPVVRYPHPALKQAADPLAPDDAATAGAVARDLVDTMRSFEHCVGLAATQLELMVRMVAVDVSGHPQATTSHGLLVLVNPRIVLATGSEVAREGCLSVPELTANVRRAREVVIEASSTAGKRLVVDSQGFEARCLQHELDHLDGILFLDRVDGLSNVFRRRR